MVALILALVAVMLDQVVRLKRHCLRHHRGDGGGCRYQPPKRRKRPQRQK